jgi:hypothetical protein
MKNLKDFNESYEYDKVKDFFPNDQFKSLSMADTILGSTYMKWKNPKRDQLWFDMVSVALNIAGTPYVSELQGAGAEFLLSVANHWAKDEKEGILKSIEKY